MKDKSLEGFPSDPMTIKKPADRGERFKAKEGEVERGNSSLMFHSEAPMSEGKKLNTTASPEKSLLGQELNTLLGKADKLIDEIDLIDAKGDAGAEEMILKEVDLLKLKEEHLHLKGELEKVDPVTRKRLQEDNQAINSKLTLIQDHIAKRRYKTAA